MKILQVSWFFKPFFNRGGVARVSYDLSKNLVDSGHEVYVYTMNDDIRGSEIKNKRLDIKTFDGIVTYYFKNLNPFGTLPIPYSLPFIARKEVKNFDVIHIHEHRTLLAVIVAHYAIKYNIPYVVQAHGSLPYSIGAKYFKIIFDFFVGKKMLKNASKVIALTNREVGQYREIGIEESKIIIIPNGIKLKDYENLPIKGIFKNKYGISEDDKIILFLGRINKIKGIDLLIEAFHDLSKGIDNIKLVIVGPDTGYLNELKETVKKSNIDDKVIFTGPLYGDDKLEAYVDADVYVLSSRYETFPITVLEAMACSVPVIITENCGISSEISDNYGISVPYNKDKLYDGINKILSDEKKSSYYARRGKQMVLDKYDLESVVNNIVNLYSIISATNYRDNDHTD